MLQAINIFRNNQSVSIYHLISIQQTITTKITPNAALGDTDSLIQTSARPNKSITYAVQNHGRYYEDV
ncbi:hypothetical protein SLEP1_g5500 [Rubroshorea leprosula]|uniref:Uncharacterized protein n=1 Tax=Rubroshorea leprosula TaxID=152421 RepID=A0AAV5HWH0_9ROSI|nr:hypothetical protein SLEP1_g5500 [Rubroshorea leprosula]